MKHFYYLTQNTSVKRGYNRTVTVFKIDRKTGRMVEIGESHHNSAAWKGDKASAGEIVANLYGYKFDGYNLVSKNITLHTINY